MAEISNGVKGPARLAARIDILKRLPAMSGMVSIGPAVLNAAMGVFHARVSLHLGEGELCGHEVLIHHSSIKGWASSVKSLIEGESDRDVVYSPIETPELIITVWRHSTRTDADPFYELLVALDTGVFDPESGISGEGPGVLLSPNQATLLQFAEDLLAEAKSTS